jgi:hypothetical protein
MCVCVLLTCAIDALDAVNGYMYGSIGGYIYIPMTTDQARNQNSAELVWGHQHHQAPGRGARPAEQDTQSGLRTRGQHRLQGMHVCVYYCLYHVMYICIRVYVYVCYVYVCYVYVCYVCYVCYVYVMCMYMSPIRKSLYSCSSEVRGV